MRMLYKDGGKHKIHGGNFDYTIVKESEVDIALNDGWFLTTSEAKKAGEKTIPKANIEDDDKPLSKSDKDLLDGEFEKLKKAREDFEKEKEEFEASKENLENAEKSLSREELEAKAEELNIKFPSNIKDETLLEKINKALQE